MLEDQTCGYCGAPGHATPRRAIECPNVRSSGTQPDGRTWVVLSDGRKITSDLPRDRGPRVAHRSA